MANVCRCRARADVSSVNFDEANIHTLASLLKKFLRELPEPLMTYELFDDFIRGTEIADVRERTQFLVAVAKKLPIANYKLLERLLYHLARYVIVVSWLRRVILRFSTAYNVLI